VSHPAALEGSSRYAREIVDRFFTEHTHIDVSHIEPHDRNFFNLTVDSQRLLLRGGQKDLRFQIIKFISMNTQRGLQ
jgi:hypothetical protein